MSGHMPLLLIAPGAMSKRDIRRAEKSGGICIVECKEGDVARFVDAPLGVPLDAQGRAAMHLVRYVMNMEHGSTAYAGYLVKLFVSALLKEPAPATVAPVKPVPNTFTNRLRAEKAAKP